VSRRRAKLARKDIEHMRIIWSIAVRLQAIFPSAILTAAISLSNPKLWDVAVLSLSTRDSYVFLSA
jgi:uncharacterized membrane protein YdjX (TVP38/TMEM64 family)